MTIAMVTGVSRRFGGPSSTIYSLPLLSSLGYRVFALALIMLPIAGSTGRAGKLFVRTDQSVLPATLVFAPFAGQHAGFLAVLVVMFSVRHIPPCEPPPGFYPRLPLWPATF